MNTKDKIDKLNALMSEIDNEIINCQHTVALKYLRLFTDDIEEIEGVSYYVEASPSYDGKNIDIQFKITSSTYINSYNNTICNFKYNHQTFELNYLQSNNEIQFDYYDDNEVEKNEKRKKIYLNKLKLSQIITNKLISDKTIIQKVHNLFQNETDVESLQQKKEMIKHFSLLFSNGRFKHEELKDEAFKKGEIGLKYGTLLTAFNGDRRYINKMIFIKNPSGTYTVDLIDDKGVKVSSSKRASQHNIDNYIDAMIREKISEVV